MSETIQIASFAKPTTNPLALPFRAAIILCGFNLLRTTMEKDPVAFSSVFCTACNMFAPLSISSAIICAITSVSVSEVKISGGKFSFNS